MAPTVAAAFSGPTQPTAAFVVRQFRPEDQEQVVATFLEGMNQYSDHYKDNATQVAYIQQSIKSDLSDIDGTYIAPGGNFWVATPVDDPTRVVGMVGLEAKPDKEAELRRMSVRRDFRRFGIGRLLLGTLERWAAEQGVEKLWLTSAAKMAHAHAFYEVFGYAQVETLWMAEDFSVFKYEKPLAGAADAVITAALED